MAKPKERRRPSEIRELKAIWSIGAVIKIIYLSFSHARRVSECESKRGKEKETGKVERVRYQQKQKQKKLFLLIWRYNKDV